MSENWISTQNQDPCINSWPLKQIWTKWAHLYLRGFFLNKYTGNPPYPQVSHLQTCPTMNQKQYFESLVGNPWMWRANRMRCSTSFYTRDLSILKILVSADGPGTNPPWIPRDNCHCILGESSYMQIFHCIKVSTPNLHVVQRPTIIQNSWRSGLFKFLL